MNKTAIVILNYKNYQETIDCLNSARQYLPKKSFCALVVDNASGNDSLIHIYNNFQNDQKVSYAENVTDENVSDLDMILVQSTKNSGYAAGNNVGLRLGYQLGYKYLMVLNNDTLFLQDFLGKFVDTIDNDPNILCVGPLLLKGDKISIDYNCAKRRPTYTDIFRTSYFGRWLKTEAWKSKYYYFNGDAGLDKPLAVDIISGSCMFYNAENFNAIDFFDEETFLYYEEAIITEKARIKGYKILLDPTSKLIHLGAQSTKKNSVSDFLLKCEYQSAMHYLTKWRKLSNFSARIVCLGQSLFIDLYKIKTLLRK